MAEPPDTSKDRMFFTDFDLSDKARSAAFVDEEPVAVVKYRLPTISDIASSLDLDFEDDGDAPPRAATTTIRKKEDGSPDENAREKRERHTTRYIFAGEDGELTLDDENLPAPPTRGLEPPTWEEFANAFSRGRGIARPKVEYVETGGEQHIDVPEISDAAGLMEIAARPEEFDVLSNLADAVIDLPPDPPTDSYAPVDKIGDWFEPPENAPGEVERVDGWFEPPEEEAEAEDERPTRRFEREDDDSSETATDMFSNVDLDEVWGNRVDSQGGTDTAIFDTRSVDLFSGLDLDTLWSEKTQADGENEDGKASGRERPGAADTMIMSALDLGGGSEGADEAYDPNQTTIFDPNEIRGSGVTRRLPRRPDDNRASGRIRAQKDTDEIDLLADLESFLDASEALDVPDAPMADTEASDYLPEDFSEAAPEETPAGPVASGRDAMDDLLDSYDFDFDDETGGASVSAPSVSNDDIQRVARRRAPVKAEEEDDPELDIDEKPAPKPKEEAPPKQERVERLTREREMRDKRSSPARPSSQSSPESSSRFSALGDPGDFDEDGGSSPDAFLDDDNYDPFEQDEEGEARFDPLSAMDGESESGEDDASAHLPEEDASDDDAGPAGSRGFSTDDLLGDIDMDFDDESVDANISAPVIDDSDIDMPGRRPRPGTEEMQAIMGEGEFAEGGAAGGEAEAEVEDAGPPADEVAVNPMDVFSNMDDMDFSGDFDDDMKAMLDEDEEEAGGGGLNIDVDGFTESKAEEAVEEPPKGVLGKIRHFALRALFRVIPARYVEKAQAMIAWRENWWFYCDLLAAIIASASLAIIISYYLWYRD